MIERFHHGDGVDSSALYSPDERYRYALTRIWDNNGQRLLWVMLNPSTATESQDDGTIVRCERRSRRLGFGAFRACNLFALRARDPRALLGCADPVGPENDAALAEAIHWADLALCAWGNHGVFMGRAAVVTAMLRASGKPLAHLGLTAAGAPRHPLHLGYAQPLLRWEPEPQSRRT